MQGGTLLLNCEGRRRRIEEDSEELPNDMKSIDMPAVVLLLFLDPDKSQKHCLSPTTHKSISNVELHCCQTTHNPTLNLQANMQSQPSTFKRFVEVGRVVLVNDGPSAGKLAVIAEIIDHNRALIDGPTNSVPRQSIAYRKLILTPYTLAKLPRGAGSAAVRKAFDKSGVSEKWEASAWAKKLAARKVRKVSLR